jgi:molecular chaperone DnaK
MTDQAAYFGIDLGTTYSVVSYVDEYGKPVVVRNPTSGNETVPSVVYFENADNIVVGAEAKHSAVVYPERVVQRVKREMGRERRWEFDGRPYTPESISALILKQLAQDAAVQTGTEVRDVVITVPAYFGMLERDATRKAGQIAGLNVIGIVPEPVAAALQYDVADSDVGRTVLVYDLGGGTFDTTVIRVAADRIEVVCTDGDQELGGVDWDDRLVSYLLSEFTDRAAPSEDPTDDAQFMQDLRERAEEVKRHLSAVTSRSVPVRFAGASAIIEVTREIFERITEDLLANTLRYTERTLEKFGAKLGDDEPARRIDEVLLVGGSSKMPAVAAALTERWGWVPRLHDPDFAVAKGAARFALSRAVWQWDGPGGNEAALTAEERRERVAVLAQRTGVDEAALAKLAAKEITNVLPKAFGVRLVDTTVPSWKDDPDGASYVEHLVHADETLPSGPRVLDAQTVLADQREIEVKIYEQAGSSESRELSANKLVDHDKGVIKLPPGLPAESPILLTMTVDTEGLLVATAVEPTSGENLTIQVRVGVLSEQEVTDLTRTVSAISVRS